MEYCEEFEDDIFIGRGLKENGKKEGLWRYFYETGELQYERGYKTGVKDGESKSFHKNGILAAEGAYKNGEAIGIWREYYENGQIQEEARYLGDNTYQYINFWDEKGNQILTNGTGKVIREYGTKELSDVYEQYFENFKFTHEIKIKGYPVLGFRPKDDTEQSG